MEDGKWQKAKDVALTDVLKKMGREPKATNGMKIKYFSPFRSEDVPSFIVYSHNNSWYDWGSGKGGDVIDFVMEMDECGFNDAVRKLMDDHSEYEAFEKPKNIAKTSGILVLDHYPIQKPALTMYAQSRGIPPPILMDYCEEVEFVFTVRDHIFHYAIGFQNSKGGWELRNPNKKVGTSPKSWSVIEGEVKTYCSIFEGFFDFLTFKTLYPSSNHDCYVLNSLVFLPWLKDTLDGYDKCYVYLDNDEAGDRYFNEHLSGPKYIDMRKTYKSFNDYNEYLINS